MNNYNATVCSWFMKREEYNKLFPKVLWRKTATKLRKEIAELEEKVWEGFGKK